jgi:hypothetical protein
VRFNNIKTNNQKISTAKKFIPYSSSVSIKAKKKKNVNKIIKNNNNIKIYNSHELNELDYDLAIDLDKRTYSQYYCSLLKKNI